MPSTLPTTAPISRRSVRARTRSSKTMTAHAAAAPTIAPSQPVVNAEGPEEVTNRGKQNDKKKT